MKYFLDTEFHEGFHKAFMKPNRHFIDLISIGIYAEDGREYYAISKEFDIKAAWDKYQQEIGKPKIYWLRENVLKPIWIEYIKRSGNQDLPIEEFSYNSFKRIIKKYGKTNKQISEEIKDFCKTEQLGDQIDGTNHLLRYVGDPEFYAYYADYDWVLFCSLFGRMLDLPENFPKYCKDLKQTLDEKNLDKNILRKLAIQSLKQHFEYPKQKKRT